MLLAETVYAQQKEPKTTKLAAVTELFPAPNVKQHTSLSAS